MSFFKLCIHTLGQSRPMTARPSGRDRGARIYVSSENILGVNVSLCGFGAQLALNGNVLFQFPKLVMIKPHCRTGASQGSCRRTFGCSRILSLLLLPDHKMTVKGWWCGKIWAMKTFSSYLEMVNIVQNWCINSVWSDQGVDCEHRYWHVTLFEVMLNLGPATPGSQRKAGVS